MYRAARCVPLKKQRLSFKELNFQRFQSTLVNQLGESTNPYLQSHQLNPVAWQQWSPETLALAKASDKPIFLSIGYHSCHWCHVMNKESFNNDEIADLLNDNFIPIKIDKEEWPDIDSIYMMYLQATHGQGGWPLNVFLTPDMLKPFFGGTYWAGPDVDPEQTKSLNAVPFTQVLQAVISQWSTNRATLEESASKISSTLAQLVDSKSTGTVVDIDEKDILAKVEEYLTQAADKTNGGFGQAPKFIMPSTLKFIFENQDKLSPESVEFANFSLRKIFEGGIKDQVGHGVARYSVTSDWHLPHFEKMLYDQALLLNASLLSRSDIGDEVSNDVVDFLIRSQLRNSEGGWFSALDADSLDENNKSHEGEFYLWSTTQFHKALAGRPQFDADICAMYWGIEQQGNVNSDLDPKGEFHYKNVLSVHKSIEEVAQTFGRKPDDIKQVIKECSRELYKWREENKVAPEVDTKIVAGWNGLALGGLARASWQLDRPSALSVAIQAAKYLHDNLWDGKELKRTNSGVPAINDDYAYMISGLLDLYEATFKVDYLHWAMSLQEQQKEWFEDPRGGFFTSQNWPWLLYRPKSGFDTAEPSSNGISANNLIRLAAMTRDQKYQHTAQHIFDNYSSDISEQPAGYFSTLSPLLNSKNKRAVALVGDDDRRAAELQSDVEKYLRDGYSVIKVDRNSVVLLPHLKDLWENATDTTLIDISVLPEL